jgi:hypothetical protein
LPTFAKRRRRCTPKVSLIGSLKSSVEEIKKNLKIFFGAPPVLSHPLFTLQSMKIVDPTELMKGFRRVDLSIAEPAELRGVLDDLRRVRARFDLVEAAVAARLRATSATPERDVAKGAQRANRHGSNVLKRAAALDDTPSLGQALETGALGGDHVDVYAKVLGALDGPVKAGLAEAAPALIHAAAASGSTPDEFAASLNKAAEQIAADDGMSRLQSQRRATRLRTWTNKATGMWHLSGAFDPESGVVLHGRLEAAMAALFGTKTPSTAPSDPGEKQDHLRAIALLAITNGDATTRAKPKTDDTNQADEWCAFATAFANNTKRFGRPEISVIIDTNNLDQNGNPTVDWGIPVTIPWSRIQDLCRISNLRPTIIREGAIIDADGQLNLGRSTRLANNAQRRALRALYATCAVPGCNVPAHHCKPHHIHWWRHGGPTDLANLLPLCSKHHHLAHEGGWLLTVGPNRELTITLPDGQIMQTGPPNRKVAA